MKGTVSRTHKVVRGDSLSGIAALYGTTVQALSVANGLAPGDVLRTGQELVILQPARFGGGSDWLKYARAPEQAGRLELSTYTERFRGVVLEKGRITQNARREISALLGVHGDRPPVPDRLIRLLVRVSDTFGGRPIRVVSGFRTSSYFSDSRHRHSAAIDFSIYGVPNAVVRQYLLLFDDVGVGYYPNSSFVHLDVREGAMQWVDYAGPGEAPRLRPYAPKLVERSRTASFSVPAPVRRVGSQPSMAELDDVAAGITAAIDAPSSASAEAAKVAAKSDPEPTGAPGEE